MAEVKPRVLVLGGVGFIGRNFVKYLVDNKLASYIKVADKSLPATAYFFPEHKEAFANAAVKVVQADLSKDAHVLKAFDEKEPFDYVINLCGETRFGLSEEDYKVKCLQTAEKCAAAAKKMGVKKWVEVSSAQVYESDKKHTHEDDKKLAPWTVQAKYRLAAEEAVRKVEGLNVVVLRPAIVYGPGDLTGLSPRLTSAAVYQVEKEKMKFLWSESLKMNVVHVDDVVAALWVAATELKNGTAYNLADESDLDQGMLAKVIHNIFHIDTGFYGMLSNFAMLDLSGAADEANDKHVPVWHDLCVKHKIENTPLTPYIDKELLRQNHLCIDGHLITKDSKFKYTKQFSEAQVRDQLKRFIDLKLFPDVIDKKEEKKDA